LVGGSVLESMIVLPATNTLSVLSSPTMYYVQIVPVEDSTGCIVCIRTLKLAFGWPHSPSSLSLQICYS